jgi:hypothetical protein
LLNLSNDGFCLEVDEKLAAGERIDIRVAGLGQFGGIVTWALGTRAGGRLTDAPHATTKRSPRTQKLRQSNDCYSGA